MVEARAPSRIDLAGGTLDIWPLSVMVPEAITVNVAIDLPAVVRVEPRRDRCLVVRSVDRKAQVRRKLPLDPKRIDGKLSLVLRIAECFDLGKGATIETHAHAPAGAGLGGSSTLAVAIAAALARFSGERLGSDALLRRVMNVEAREIGVPTGNQDYLAAIHGGLTAYHHEADGVRVERLPLPDELAEHLVLAYTGEPRRSGFSNWEMYRRFIEGEKRSVDRFETIARIGQDLAAALREGDLDACGELLAEEGKLRNGLAPTVAPPTVRKVMKAAVRAGAIGAKVCGAGGGGCLVAFVDPARWQDVADAMTRNGARVLPFEVASRGVRVRRRG